MCATRPSEIADHPLRLEVLHEEGASRGDDLPAGLRRTYGGELRLDGPGLVANFVSSVDGVVALEMKHSPGVISQRSEADRFVMGLLRARADAVLIGGGTMRADPGHRWTAEHIYPDAAGEFQELRRSHGQPEEPRLVVLTAGGDIDVREPALEHALVVTTPAAARRLTERLPSSATIRALDPITPAALVAVLHEERLGLVLSEAGPTVFGQLVAAGCLRELFLTVSPVLAGSDAPGRKTLSQGMALREALATMDLVSARRFGSHLFLRYQLRDTGEAASR